MARQQQQQMFSLKVINENRNPYAQELFRRNTSVSEHETLVKEKQSTKKSPKNKSKAVFSLCKENQGGCPGSWWWAVGWGEVISSLPTKLMGMDPQHRVLVKSGWFTAQGSWHEIWPEVLVPGRGRTALLIAWAEAENRGGTRAESWASSPGGCQLKLSLCSTGGILGWPLGCNSGREMPFGSHNKLCMKCQSTDWAQVNVPGCVIPF